MARHFLGRPVLGFDLEWAPQSRARDGVKRNVSLIQLAVQDKIALFHLALFRDDDFVAPTLKHIMESADVTKVGVSIKADCTRLRNFLHIDSRGLFELSHLYKLVKYSSTDAAKINKRLVSLAQQVEEHLQLPLWKGEVRSSDWSKELGRQQIDYAASDSYAAVQLYDVLEAKREALHPAPPRPAHAELNLPIQLADGGTISTIDDSLEVDGEPRDDEVGAERREEVVDGASVVQVNSGVTYPQLPALSTASLTQSLSRVSVSDSPSSRHIAHPTEGPLYHLAAAWATTHHTSASSPEPPSPPLPLLAYALWHRHGLSISTTTQYLSMTDIERATIAGHIRQVVTEEGLEVDAARFRTEVLHLCVDGQR